MLIATGELGTLHAIEIDARARKQVLARLKRRGAYAVDVSGYRHVPGYSFFRQTIMYVVALPGREDELVARYRERGIQLRSNQA